MENNIKISVRNLYKIFGENPESVLDLVKNGMTKPELLEQHSHVLGLNNINVDMREGEITVIMGLSGSGKSTLIRHINRLIDPTAGEVIYDDEDVLAMDMDELREVRRRKMSMVFQKFALLPHKTVLENAAISYEINKDRESNATETTMKWLERVGLGGYEHHYPHQLSGGMQQRVGIARALSSNAEVMLMDEAFSALDPIIRSGMQDLLLELQTELHKTIIFITHDLDEALKLADHLVILNEGYIVQQGEPQHILLNPNDPYIEEFVADINRARVLRVRSVMLPMPKKAGKYDADVDYNDNLESVIDISGGDTSKTYRVMRDGKPVGILDMKVLVKALVPRSITAE